MAAKYEDRSIGDTPGALPRAREPQSALTTADRGFLGDTLPPQPLKELLSAGGANLYVLSADAELIATVQRAAGEQYPVFAVQQWAELEAAIFAGRCGIVLLDAELVGGKLVEHINALQTHAGRVVTLAAADRAVAQELMGYLSDRRIHRLLIKPAAPGITRLLVESAVNRCLQLRDLAAGSDGLETLGRSRDPKGARRWPRVAFGMLAVVGVVAAAAWLWRPSVPSNEATEPAQSSAAAPLAVTDERDIAAESIARAELSAELDALFAQAESALLANSLDDAATALADVRRADPSSSRLAFLEAQLARATAARTAAGAVARPATNARGAGGSPGVAQSAPAAAAPTELDSLLVIATARIARGQLLEPPGDSAFEYLRRATELNGSDSRVVRGRAALATAVLESARVALANGGLGDATRLLAAAKDLGADAEALASVELELAGTEQATAERQRTEWLELASTRLRAGALAEPLGDSALDYLRKVQAEAPNFAGLNEAWDGWIAALGARVRQSIASRSWAAGEAALAAMAAAPRGAIAAAPLREQLETERLQAQYLAAASPAGELNLLDAPPLVYPPDARRLNIQGWVELEFVVDRTGQPKDIVVVAAEPTGRFDQAALAAVAKYRYAPFEGGGHVYERRVRQRIRFALN